VLLQHGITPSWKSDFDNTTVTPPSEQGQFAMDNVDHSDEEDKNQSELDEEEDIVANFAFDD
jgi:hypothetical protein